MTRRHLALAAAILALGLTACSSDPEPEAPTTTPAAEPTHLYNDPVDRPTSPGDAAEGDSLVNAHADAAAEEGATAAGVATAQVWVQGSTMDQRDWNDALMATLTPLAQDAYQDRWWGYRIEATEITGEPVLSEATMTTAIVTVPTNDGDLVLTVTRTDETTPWLTAGIEPAQDPA